MTRRNTREDILNEAIHLFTDCGYNGVSMRSIARSCNLNVGSLYHHFSDKQELYLAAIQQAFSGRSSRLRTVLESDQPARQRLCQLVDVFCQLVAEDQTFSRMVQREVVEGDEQRLKQLAEQVFGNISEDLQQLCREVNPHLDPLLFSCSLIGMVLHLFHYADLNRHLPGFRPEHDRLETIRHHLQQLLCQGLIQPTQPRGSS